MSITAVINSAGGIAPRIDGLDVVIFSARVMDMEQFQAARFAAVRLVRTSRFFFLDDDDELPSDVGRILDACENRDEPLVYTDEIIRSPDGSQTRKKAAPYDRQWHMHNIMSIHHLVLCDTWLAQSAITRIPRGHFAPEPMLYWELARGGAAYVPEAGYIWNKRANGMHTWPAAVIGQMRTRLWMKENP